jgi:hypothetical protein
MEAAARLRARVSREVGRGVAGCSGRRDLVSRPDPGTSDPAPPGGGGAPAGPVGSLANARAGAPLTTPYDPLHRPRGYAAD